MVRWLRILFRTLRSCLRTHRELALDNACSRSEERLTAEGAGGGAAAGAAEKCERMTPRSSGVRRLLNTPFGPCIVPPQASLPFMKLIWLASAPGKLLEIGRLRRRGLAISRASTA